MAVYQSAREGASLTRFRVSPLGASYTVRLHFAELYFSAAGNREFNVAINGTTVLTNFDIFATAGAKYTAVVETFHGHCQQQRPIVVAFTNGAIDQPMFNGIEVLELIHSSCSCCSLGPNRTDGDRDFLQRYRSELDGSVSPANCTVSSYSVYGRTPAASLRRPAT